MLEIILIPLRCFKQIFNPHANSQHVQSALLSFVHLIIIKQRVFDRADSVSVTYGVIYLVVLGEGKLWLRRIVGCAEGGEEENEVLRVSVCLFEKTKRYI